jgi:hypothetical protein
VVKLPGRVMKRPIDGRTFHKNTTLGKNKEVRLRSTRKR